jgi:hypothetical protein
MSFEEWAAESDRRFQEELLALRMVGHPRDKVA